MRKIKCTNLPISAHSCPLVTTTPLAFSFRFCLAFVRVEECDGLDKNTASPAVTATIPIRATDSNRISGLLLQQMHVLV